MSEPRATRRESTVRLVLFLVGFLPVTVGVIAFLLPMAHGPARYTFTGSPPIDAVLIGVVIGVVMGLSVVGVRQLLKGNP